MTNISSNHTVQIIESGSGCDFDPKQIEVNPGDTVTFINKSANPVAISFSVHDVFDAAFINLTPGMELAMEVKVGAEASCHCMVNCNTSSTIVFYASKPEIIIIRQ